MNTTQDPSTLAPRFRPPDNFEWGSFERTSGRMIRYGYNIPNGGKADHIIVDFPGLNDPIEKQFEAYRELEARNIAVFCMEWMGQGGSARYLSDQRRHSDDFDNDVRDAMHFIRKSIPAKLKALGIERHTPKILKAHSMGGHMALRCLSKLPVTFNKAVISAPMIEVASLPIPQDLRLYAASALCAILGEERYTPFAEDWNPDNPARQVGSDVYSSDAARSALHNIWMAQNPVGGVTNKWVYDAHVSIRQLREDFAAITTPTFIGVAAEDVIVDSEATIALFTSSQHVKTHLIQGAKHEIWNEADQYRDKMMQQLYTLDMVSV